MSEADMRELLLLVMAGSMAAYLVGLWIVLSATWRRVVEWAVNGQKENH